MFGAGELIGASVAGVSTYSLKNRVVYRRTEGVTDLEGAPSTERRALGLNLVKPRIGERSAPRPLTPSTTDAVPMTPVKGVPERLDPHPDAQTFEKANQDLSSSSEMPTDPNMRMVSGIALYSAGDLERALHELRAASLLDEQLWPATIYQGMCLESMGHPDLARAEYRHAVQVLERNPESYSLLPQELDGLGRDLLEMARRKSGASGRGSSLQFTPQGSVMNPSGSAR